jgi:purine-binding chemotaxis protein CheW
VTPTTPQRRRGNDERINAARAVAFLDEALSPSPERTRAIMDERARALARTPSRKSAPSDQRDAVIFRLAGERYGIEAPFVREVVRTRHFTRVPSGADLFLGVINLRGEILGVADFCKLLGLPAKSVAELPWLVVLGTSRAEFAVAVETVEDVTLVRVNGLTAGADADTRPKRPFVRGISTDALILLDGGALIDEPRLFAGLPPAATELMREGINQ